MRSNLMYPILVGLCIAAITGSAKSIIDVEVLKSENKNQKELLLEVRNDVKQILMRGKKWRQI